MNRASFFKKISFVFLGICIICTILCGISIGLLVHESAKYKNCNELSNGTLNSCVNQTNGNKTYYFGIYTFTYNNAEWNYLNTDYYTDLEEVPDTITIKHNNFSSEEEMVATISTSRSTMIPVIYGIVAILAFMLFIFYRSNYKEQDFLNETKITLVKDELDEE